MKTILGISFGASGLTALSDLIPNGCWIQLFIWTAVVVGSTLMIRREIA